MSRVSRVVCNASPLIHLAKVGQLAILKDLYQEILIPREVFDEICGTQDTPDSIVISAAIKDGWVKVMDWTDNNVFPIAKGSGIHTGEAAAILLAKERNALLLIDDKMGKSAAEILGIACLGTVGVLLQALANSMMNLSKFTNALNRMMDSGFRLDSKVYREVLRIAGETSRSEDYK